ncbi:hypothetical protein FOXG_14898 [Fusarium oxysporum f. sp. lycopersici 4287]|uniref:BTB domain-containing protein n=2 Tax=Fusarium oxysporum TaxID=5507 RepID=A0A0J9W177_FUSO4|nr:hypothetical protein FOXG_14898 [Fusarium oxysporum f. sp. lycopersici 4287]KNB16874.1 hypothetical protein FOXG_14898 [Fusarium oxysporum f. sp. lycopersici 4287]
MEDEQRKDENGEFLVLICEGKKFHVRKTALFTQSKVFHTAFTGPFSNKYAVDILLSLSAAKYLDGLRNSEIVEFLGSIPAVYELTPSYVRNLRDEAIKHARINLPQGLGNPSVRQIYEGIAVIKHYREYKAAACNVAMTQPHQRADRRGRDEFAQTAFGRFSCKTPLRATGA